VGDRWLTPFSVLDRAPGPGLEVQAAAIQTILNGGWRRTVEPSTGQAIVFVFGALGGLWAGLAGGLVALSGLVILAVGFIVVAWRVFVAGTFIPLLAPLVALAAGGGVAVATRWRREEGERRRLDSLFGRYVSREVAVALRDHPELVKLGGEEAEVTVLFADLRGFTGLAERLPPARLVEVLNGYLSAMAGAVFEAGGTLDKYTGDGLMAFFNAPIRQDNHAERAVRAAVEIRRRVAEVRQGLEVPGKAPEVGVGLNTGTALVGNIGTRERLEYTVIGDEVNLAARLKDMAGPGEILAGHGVVGRTGAGYGWREWGRVEVRGRTQPVSVFALGEILPVAPAPLGPRRRHLRPRVRGGDRVAKK
ncbi:MAG: adenylate/guanylate cyclase domain-containing protein, partial [Bacillota bacterium]